MLIKLKNYVVFSIDTVQGAFYSKIRPPSQQSVETFREHPVCVNIDFILNYHCTDVSSYISWNLLIFNQKTDNLILF